MFLTISVVKCCLLYKSGHILIVNITLHKHTHTCTLSQHWKKNTHKNNSQAALHIMHRHAHVPAETFTHNTSQTIQWHSNSHYLSVSVKFLWYMHVTVRCVMESHTCRWPSCVYWAHGILAFIKPTPRDLSPLELQTELLKIEQLAPSTSVLHKSKTLIQIASI